MSFSKNNQDSFIALGNALNRLEELILIPEEKAPEFLQDAIIQRFEFSIELYWKVLKKLLLSQGIDSNTPRDTLGKAFQNDLIDDEES